jgi:predicted nucleic acid-binding protein
MKILLDTNILLRLSEANHPHHAAAIAAVRKLSTEGHVFCIASQTIGEFLAVATRAIPDRGLGMSQKDADTQLSKLITAIEVLYDSAAVMAELRRLVIAHNVVGKSVHDTRLVASMISYGVKDILTFNKADFVRFTSIQVLDPTGFTASGSPTQT